MNKKLIINISVFVLIILFLIISFFSIKKVTSNGMKVEVLNNNKVNEQIYISDLIKFIILIKRNLINYIKIVK